MFINAVLIDRNNLDQFIALADTDLERFICISNPIDKFSDMNIDSAVDECTYNFLEYGDVYYHIPSQQIRDMLEIVDEEHMYCNSA